MSNTTPDEAMTAMVDAAMAAMSNIVPPLRRSDCERLIRAALDAQPPPRRMADVFAERDPIFRKRHACPRVPGTTCAGDCAKECVRTGETLPANIVTRRFTGPGHLEESGYIDPDPVPGLAADLEADLAAGDQAHQFNIDRDKAWNAAVHGDHSAEEAATFRELSTGVVECDPFDPDYIESLAELADPSQLWRLGGFQALDLPADRQHQLHAGVALRRHASHMRKLRELLEAKRSLLITPLSVNGTATRDIETPPDHAILRHRGLRGAARWPTP